MVHLASIKNDSEIPGKMGPGNKRMSIVPGMENICLDAPGDDEFSSSVYGSRFASEDLPAHELPEREMPKEIAYRMIKDELSLDGNPMLKFVPYIFVKELQTDFIDSLASFVTTYMASDRSLISSPPILTLLRKMKQRSS